MQLIDTHCHLDLADFDADREQVLERCHQSGIDQIIVPAIESSGWKKLLEISAQHTELFPALGLHPVFIKNHNDDDLTKLEQQLYKHTPVAVGEIGLDFFIKDTDKNRQIDIFEKQLAIAESYKLPVILHVRKAHDDVLKLLKTKSVPGGTCHAYSGSEQQARQYIDMGFKLGFGGTLTYPNARKIHMLARALPIEYIVLETDAPDMTGYAHKGERNSPEYLPEALNALSAVKSLDIEYVAEQTTKNARELFQI